MKGRRTAIIWATVGLVAGPAPGAERYVRSSRLAQHVRWSSQSAYPVPERRLEIGLFQSTHYGLAPDLELGAPTLSVFVWPAFEAKWLVAEGGAGAGALRAKLSYPTPFLRLVSKSGAGGLLPETSDVPQAIAIDADAVGTLLVRDDVLATAWLGEAVAPHAARSEAELPVLDFPFLYPRLAALHTPVVPRAGLAVEGHLVDRLYYTGDYLLFVMPSMPYTGTTFALEHGQSFEWRFSDRVAFSIGLRSSYARYGYGLGAHYLPYADVRVGL